MRTTDTLIIWRLPNLRNKNPKHYVVYNYKICIGSLYYVKFPLFLCDEKQLWPAIER